MQNKLFEVLQHHRVGSFVVGLVFTWFTAGSVQQHDPEQSKQPSTSRRGELDMFLPVFTVHPGHSVSPSGPPVPRRLANSLPPLSLRRLSNKSGYHRALPVGNFKIKVRSVINLMH